MVNKMPTTEPPTPRPKPVVFDDENSQSLRLGHECPYRDEVHTVRRLQALGIEELAVIGRRRDRVAIVIAGAALGAVLTLGGGALNSGLSLARTVGHSESRLDQLEKRPDGAESTASHIAQLARLDARLEGLEERLGDRLEQIERRLDRSESRAVRPTQRRR